MEGLDFTMELVTIENIYNTLLKRLIYLLNP